MASKKAGRLAGLAALAGLAYMATRDKDKGAKGAVKSKSESYDRDTDTGMEVMPSRDTDTGMEVMPSRDTDTGMEVMPSYAAKKPAADLGAIYDEAGTLSTLRRNTETGELYNPGVGAAAYQARRDRINANVDNPGYSAGMKKGGKVKKMASGGTTSSASKRGDGIAQRGKTRGKMR